jgi:hypothetical protein
MKRLITLAFLLAVAVGFVSAQTISTYPATVTIPRGGVQTCAAEISGVNNKTATFTTTGGTLVGINPSVANEPAVIGLTTTTPGTYTVTATPNASGSFTGTTTCVITVSASPTPQTGHPKLGGMTVANLSAMRAKAGQACTSGNILYNDGECAFAVTLYSTANAEWNWSCGGGPSNTKTGQPLTDQSASYDIGANYEGIWWIFSHMGMIDPTDATYKFPCYAHDLGMYYVNYWLAPDSSQYGSGSAPYRATDMQYGLTGNHGSDNTSFLTLSPDWTLQQYSGEGSGATLTATLTSGTMNTPTITAGGSGYLPNSIVYWYAFVSSSGCATQGHYGSYESSVAGNNGTPFAAMGVAQTNGSGVVAGTVTTLVNGTTCTTAPTIIVYSDQQMMRNYLDMARKMMIDIQFTGAVAPVGSYNSSAQFDTGNAFDFTGMRANGNNYTLSKNMYLIAAALTFDNNSTDDPPTPNTCSAAVGVVCPDGSAYNLFASWTYETGGMLYRAWAHFDDPNVTWQAYQAAYANLPTQPMCDDIVSLTTTIPRVPCFGDGRGGEGSEGVSYAYSFYRLAEAVVSIHSAGYDDPILYGPQMSLGTSVFWDLHANSNLGFLSYTNNASSLRYSSFHVGDIFNFPNPSTFADSSWMMIYDASVGRTDRTAVLEWPLIATSPGGPSDLYTTLHGLAVENNVSMFIGLPSGDPSTSFPSDPRGTLPLTAYAANNQSIFARSEWVTNGPESPSDTGSPPATTQQVFFTHAPNTRIDHEEGDVGRYDVMSNGEYITKGRAIDFPEYNYMLSAAEHTNLFGLAANQTAVQSTVCVVSAGYFLGYACQGMAPWMAQTYTSGSIVFDGSSYWTCTGTPCASTDVPGTAGDWTTIAATATKGAGQMFHGLQAGNATLHHNEMPNYIAFDVDQTPLYSATQIPAAGCCTGVTGVTAASRSLVYLRGTKQVVTYDREAGAQFSRDWITTTGAVTVSGITASWPTQSGLQKAYWTNLLPATGVTMSDAGGYLTNLNGNPGNEDWEPVSHVLEDLGSPSSAQVLNVLEWGASGFTKSTTTAVQSNAGQGFDCALINTTMACFMRSWPGTLTSTTYAASGATAHYVSDLTPNTAYALTGAGTPSTCTTDNAGVCVFSATGTGNITINGSSIPPPVQLNGHLILNGKVSVQ